MSVNSVFQSSQIRALEQAALTDLNLSEYQLMQRAGAAAADLIQKDLPSRAQVLVVCGPGNNGGDGYVVASQLKKRWHQVKLTSSVDPDILNGAAELAKNQWLEEGGAIEIWSGKLPEASLIIDSLFGIGLSRPLATDYLDIVNAINAADVEVVSLDLPSGLSSDTGIILGVCVQAKKTITFIAYKLGQLMADGPDYCGELELEPLNLPESIFKQETGIILLQKSHLGALPTRCKNSHKGNHGHVVCIGGSPGMTGAIRMSAEAALRTGAGKVTIITHPEHSRFIAADRPEIMLCGASSVDDAKYVLESADVIAFGPGMADDSWSHQWLSWLMQSGTPLVVDAGGLSLLAESFPWENSNAVLTPHPGEAAVLLGKTSAEIQSDRLSAIQALYAISGATVVLKGNGSLICNGGVLSLCTAGNSGMATAGMGDILTGIIAALIGQGLTTGLASELGVLIHAMAGDQAAGSEPVGLLATDLYPEIRAMVNSQC